MKAINILFACLLLPGVSWAQAGGQDPSSSAAGGTGLASEVQALREALSQTQKQVAAQASEIQILKAQSRASAVTTATDDQALVERTSDLSSPGLGATGTYDMAGTGRHPRILPNKQGTKRNRPRALSNLITRLWQSAASSISRTYSALPIPGTISQRHSDLYRSATRLRDRSRNFVPRHNTLGLT